MNSKLLGLISICRKAGKVAIGFDPAAEALAAGKAALVLVTPDLSPKTRSELEYRINKGVKATEMIELPLTMDDLSAVLGKRAGILAVLDNGLADALRRQTNREENSEYVG